MINHSIKAKSRRQKISYETSSNYDVSNDTTTQATPDTRNYTPNILDLKSFEPKAAACNYTSEKAGYRPMESHINLSKVNDFQRPNSFFNGN